METCLHMLLRVKNKIEASDAVSLAPAKRTERAFLPRYFSLAPSLPTTTNKSVWVAAGYHGDD